MHPFENDNKFNIEKVIVYKQGEGPSEKESHEIIWTVLSQGIDDFTLSAIRSIIKQCPIIPLLELREWRISSDEIENYGGEMKTSSRMFLNNEYIVKTFDSQVYRVCFLISGQKKVPKSQRLQQMEEIKKLLVPFQMGRTGPALGLIKFEFSLEYIYDLFTPGKLMNKDVWIADETIISPKAVFFPPVLIGKGCLIDDYAVVGPSVIAALGLRIGRWSIISQSIVVRFRMDDHSMMLNVIEGKGVLK